MNETFKEMMDRVQTKRKHKNTINMKIHDCPMTIYTEFIKDVHEYNNMYWVKLKDVMRKAEFYDNIVSMNGSNIVHEPKPEQEENEQELETDSLTIGDIKRIREGKENE